MDAIDVLVIVLLVAASVLCAVAIWSLRELVLTARSLKLLSDDTRQRLVPLLDKADVTVDAVNAELLRVDAIITTFEEASEKVSHASGTISNIVSAPGEIANEMATRVRRKWGERRRTAESAQDAPASSEDSGDAAEDGGANGQTAQDEVVTSAGSAEPWGTDDGNPTED